MATDVDVVATLDVLQAMIARHARLRMMDLAEMFDWQVEKHREWVKSYNAWRAWKAPEHPAQDPSWPLLLAYARAVCTGSGIRAPGCGVAVAASGA